MHSKISLAVLFGGQSAEHEVSLQSAKNVIEALDPEKYQIVLIGIDKSGRWLLYETTDYLRNSDNPEEISLSPSEKQVVLINQRPGIARLVDLSSGQSAGTIDVVFPVLHGTGGEDGTLQGMLQLVNVPFVGAGVLGSAIGMDEDIMKRLLCDAGIPTADYVTLYNH